MTFGRFTGERDYNIEMNSRDICCKDVLVELSHAMLQWRASVFNLQIQ